MNEFYTIAMLGDIIDRNKNTDSSKYGFFKNMFHARTLNDGHLLKKNRKKCTILNVVSHVLFFTHMFRPQYYFYKTS